MRTLLTLTLSLATAAGLVQAQPGRQALNEVNSALQAGEADHALSLLQALTQPEADSAEAHNLRCRVLLTEELWDAAAAECEKAASLDIQNSNYHLWLGRSLGERADRASFVNAYSLAKKTRGEFEESVRLDPRNADALADLGEFYYSAPGVVGGGVDKAEKIAAQLDKVDAARGHELRGRIAEQRKDFETAEREFKQAASSSAHPAFQWITLASFYRRRERWPEMLEALRTAAKFAERDKHAAVALANGASVLIKANREPQMAVRMLEEYLASPAKSEEAPAFVAHTRLARLKEQLGDSEGARQNRAAALAEAHDFKPAQGAKH